MDATIPFLFIEGYGGSNPVILSGPLSTQFLWDAQRRVHVHRFTSLADFRERSRQIISDESVWTIFPGIDDEAEAGDGSSELEDRDRDPDELALQLAACQAIAEGEDLELVDAIANHPAVKAVALLSTQAKFIAAAAKLAHHNGTSQQPKPAPTAKPRPRPKRKR